MIGIFNLSCANVSVQHWHLSDKMLDAIGDLYLAGYQLLAEYEGVKSGHALNNQLVRALFEQPECWEWATFDDPAESPIDWTLSQDLQFG